MVLYYSCIIPRIGNLTEKIIILTISVVLHILFVFSMVFTATTNPGIIPKMELDISYLCRISKVRPKSIKYLWNYKGVLIKKSFCSSCLIIRPPRTCHCYFWGNWVENFDHHCSWLSTCIGKRNYGYFITFISCLSVSFLLTTWISIKTFGETDGDIEEMIKENITNIIMIFYNWIAGFFPLLLTIYHYTIIIKGESTYENMKGIFSSIKNPFKRGIMDNIKMQLWRKRGIYW